MVHEMSMICLGGRGGLWTHHSRAQTREAGVSIAGIAACKKEVRKLSKRLTFIFQRIYFRHFSGSYGHGRESQPPRVLALWHATQLLVGCCQLPARVSF